MKPSRSKPSACRCTTNSASWIRLITSSCAGSRNGTTTKGTARRRSAQAMALVLPGGSQTRVQLVLLLHVDQELVLCEPLHHFLRHVAEIDEIIKGLIVQVDDVVLHVLVEQLAQQFTLAVVVLHLG